MVKSELGLAERASNAHGLRNQPLVGQRPRSTPDSVGRLAHLAAHKLAGPHVRVWHWNLHHNSSFAVAAVAVAAIVNIEPRGPSFLRPNGATDNDDDNSQPTETPILGHSHLSSAC